MKAKLFLGVFLLTSTAILFYLYFFLGFRYAVDIAVIANSRNKDDQEKIKSMLSYDPSNPNVNKGIVLQLNGYKKLNGLWLWNYNGIKYYKVSDSIELNSFSICEGEKWKEASGTLAENANINYEKWSKSVHKGDYLELLLNSYGNLRSVSAYDWWVFAQPLSYSDLEQTCKNR